MDRAAKRARLHSPEAAQRNEQIACTSNGVLVLFSRNEEGRPFLLFINIHTRCQISRYSRNERMNINFLHVIDDDTIVAFGWRFAERGRLTEENIPSPPIIYAIMFTSKDGFKTIISTELKINIPPSPFRRYPWSYVPVGNGIMMSLRHGEDHEQNPLYFTYISLRELCQEGSSNKKTKSVNATAVGSIDVMGSDRFTEISYNDTCFAVLKGDAGNNRIDIYDVHTNNLSHSISVDWPLSTTFPTMVVHPLPYDGTSSILLQSILGDKFRLDLETGAVESIPPFIPSMNSTVLNVKNCVHALTSRVERQVAGLADVDDERYHWTEDFEDESVWTPVVDAIYMVSKWVNANNSIMGWFATDLMDGYRTEAQRHITLLRVPLNKVHSLETLAFDAVNKLLKEKIRKAITSRFNPLSTTQYIKAIREFSRSENTRKKDDPELAKRLQNTLIYQSRS